jgi:hypothetical protein
METWTRARGMQDTESRTVVFVAKFSTANKCQLAPQLARQKNGTGKQQQFLAREYDSGP